MLEASLDASWLFPWRHGSGGLSTSISSSCPEPWEILFPVASRMSEDWEERNGQPQPPACASAFKYKKPCGDAVVTRDEGSFTESVCSNSTVGLGANRQSGNWVHDSSFEQSQSVIWKPLAMPLFFYADPRELSGKAFLWKLFSWTFAKGESGWATWPAFFFPGF